MKNLLKDKRRLRRLVLHELIHYAFTEYEYLNGGDKPSCWKVGLCSREKTASKPIKSLNKKWKIDEWLDEVLTEAVAIFISGAKSGNLRYCEEFVYKKDAQMHERVCNKFTGGTVYFEDIINALRYHDKDIFLRTVL